MKLALVLSLLLPIAASAQDERQISSPDGALQFRIFISSQPETTIVRLAYQVIYKQHPLIKTSFLALDIWEQYPMLGETTGLVGSHTESHPSYNTLVANYMQNGSLGRLLNIETRVYNDAIAFRYVIPRSTAMFDFLLDEEATEFDPVPDPPLPIQITELPLSNFPTMHLERGDDHIQRTRLAHRYEGKSPFTLPWRIILLGAAKIPPDLSN